MQAQAKPHMQPSVETMATLLATSTGPGKSLRVPEYQRSYAWDKRQYDEFWNDILGFADENRPGSMYFLGIVVFVDSDEREILDGQQRLSTATILLTSIGNFLKELGETEYAKKIFDDFVVGSSLGGDDRTYRIILNSHDRSYFQALIQDGVEAISDGTPSHTAIRACKAFFDDKLRSWLKLDSKKPRPVKQLRDEAIARAKRLAQSLLYRVYVVSITALRLLEAGNVFERLNDRGARLSSVELVRSWVMQRCKESDRDLILKSWGEIFQVQGRGSVNDLLRFHWKMRWGDRSSAPQHTLIKKEFTKDPPDPSYTPLQFTLELRKSASVYYRMCAAKEGECDEFWDIVSWVMELNVKPLIPLLMKLDGFDNPEIRARVAKTAFTAFVRNRLVADQSSTSFEDVVYRVTRDIKASRRGIKKAMDELAGYTFGDGDFVRGFETRTSPLTQKQAKFLLRGIESFLLLQASGGNREIRLGSSSQVHIEHIYPKNPLEGHTLDQGEEWVNRFGNLTLLASRLNRKIQNQPFAQKKPHYEKSQLNVTAQLLQYESWGTNEIVDREAWLAELATKVWPKRT